MKFLLLCTAMLVASLTGAAEPPISFPEYDAPRAKYLEALGKTNAARQVRLAPLNRTYSERLEGMRKTMAGSGDAAGAAAVAAEIERVKKGVDPTTAERNAMPGLLRVQRTAYEKERFIGAPEEDKADAQTDAAWAAQLEPLLRKLLHPLQTDKLAREKAAIVKAEIDRIAAKTPHPAPLVKPVAGNTPPTAPAVVTPIKPVKPPKPNPHPVAIGIANDATRKTAADLVQKLKLKNSTGAPEAEDILAKAVSHDLGLLQDVTAVTLQSVHDAAVEPMKHNSGEPVTLRGSWSKKVLLGTNSGIMIWGPYETLEAGRYIIVYRFKFRGTVRGDDPCFLDVAHDGNTKASLHPKPNEKEPNEWLNLGVALTQSKPRAMEYRMWPYNNEVAVDRIYVYRLTVPE